MGRDKERGGGSMRNVPIERKEKQVLRDCPGTFLGGRPRAGFVRGASCESADPFGSQGGGRGVARRGPGGAAREVVDPHYSNAALLPPIFLFGQGTALAEMCCVAPPEYAHIVLPLS
ncbi:hypothetical protein EVAR_60864_1 [Eumeta japonica]|uniref:Uncharacterized protein n=1 Tax=Eumeta variegata TaxID=151549 RepID=A0A4C1Y5V4_EUMVA|nr:hypothetical protein EVAR_60864_1 [Eumeta japonica]